MMRGSMTLRTLFIPIFALFLCVLGTTKSMSQDIDFSTLISKPAPDDHEVCTINPTEHNTFFYLEPDPKLKDLVRKSAGSIFEVDFFVNENKSCGDQSWPTEASSAFLYALDIWAAHLNSKVPIKVSATWNENETDDDTITLGSAAPSVVVQIPGIGKPDTFYPIAHLSALAGTPIRDQLDDVDYDINVTMNCGYPGWYFGIDAKTPPNHIDFVTVILHEIGHGIGFIGSVQEVSEDSETAKWGFSDPPTPGIFDRFVVDGEDHFLIDETEYPNPSAALFEALTGKRGGIFLEGEEINHTLTSQHASKGVLYSPDEFRKGSSYSHLDQQTFSNTENALMRPSMDRASAIHTPGPLFCGLLRDMEWPLGDACLEKYLRPFASILTQDDEFHFGISFIDDPVQQTIIIENSQIADTPLNISGEIIGDNFDLIGPSQFTVEPGNFATFQVLYNPSEVGIHTAELTLTHDGKNISSPLTIKLSGESLRSNQLVNLGQSFPNPVVSASSGATISYAIPIESNVRLDLYTVDGRHIQSIVNSRQQSGRYEVNVDLNGLTSGIYIYRIAVDSDVQTKKLMLFR